eukprot:Plantae.Rhodophyta-Hildenbrandia_rubra.ctg12276.p1 GENE.Plantae.Rhodophyta-Hildenbrandia_rubra.ctg12276~~Plantae.Rhodophyta-Hildenbrandia_rubra.ctg12276.p1  ORF type:complete len:158 (+),score=26.66 Plantae.Rhodophyta-Hildenbrandia_rubra.ctg12276:834-1307(+)
MDIRASFRIALKPLLNRDLPLHMHADSKSLFDTIAKRSQAREKRLLIDIASARDSYKKREISDIGWARSECNLADPMTKQTRSNALDEALDAGALDHPVEQWIAREEASPKKKSLRVGRYNRHARPLRIRAFMRMQWRADNLHELTIVAELMSSNAC